MSQTPGKTPITTSRPGVDELAVSPQSEEQADLFARLLRKLERLEGSGLIRKPIQGFEPFTVCLCGKKSIHPEEIKVATKQVPGFRFIDRTCSDCRKDLVGYPRIYCIGCEELIVITEPRVLSSGFQLKTYGRYHVKDCPRCNPEYYKVLEEMDKIKNPTDEQVRMIKAKTRMTTIEEHIYLRKTKKNHEQTN